MMVCVMQPGARRARALSECRVLNAVRAVHGSHTHSRRRRRLVCAARLARVKSFNEIWSRLMEGGWRTTVWRGSLCNTQNHTNVAKFGVYFAW